MCNESHLEIRDGMYRAIGSPTETALKVLVEKIGYPGNNIKFNNTSIYAEDACFQYASKYIFLI